MEQEHHSSAIRSLRPWRWIRRVLLGVTAVVVVLAAVMVFRAIRITSRQPAIGDATDEAVVATPEQLAARLAGALRFATVSSSAGPVDPAAFVGLHAYLKETFPRVHQAMRREMIGEYSALYTWTGSEPAAPPIVLLAHLDVVPAAVTAATPWSHPPFAGAVADGFVWGRGALDDKLAAIAILEAAEQLATAGFQPRQTIVLAFGHDEEVGGRAGAAKIAAALAQRGVRAELVLDEGLAITQGLVDGIAAPVALVGIGEKGFVDVSVTADVTGGHASMPPAATAVGILGRALAAIEDEPMPSSLGGAALETFTFLAPEMAFGQRVLMSNLWLVSPLVQRVLAGKPSSNALLRTTIAPTMLSGSDRSNVLSAQARATLNVRLLPGDTVDDVIGHLRRVVDDSRITIQQGGELAPPSRLSPADSANFLDLMRTIREVDPQILVAPGLVVAGTDSKHYAGLSDHVYRFSPIRVGPSDLPRLHGVDERIAVADLHDAVEFYVRLMKRFAGPPRAGRS